MAYRLIVNASCWVLKEKKNSITKMGMEMRELFSNRLGEINKKEIAALGFFMECVCTVTHEYIYSDLYVLFKLEAVIYSSV